MKTCVNIFLFSVLSLSISTASAGFLDKVKGQLETITQKNVAEQEAAIDEKFSWCQSDEERKAAALKTDPKADPKAQAEVERNAMVQENERVVKCLIASLIRVADAQADFAVALNAKDQAELLRAESKALSQAHYTDQKALEKHVKVSKNTNEVIRTKISQDQKLTNEGQKQFSSGLFGYALALKETKEMTDAVGPYYKATKTEAKKVYALYNQGKSSNLLGSIAGGLKYMKELFGKSFGTTQYLVKKGKGLVKDHKSTIESVVAYAKENNIEIPPEAKEPLSFI